MRPIIRILLIAAMITLWVAAVIMWINPSVKAWIQGTFGERYGYYIVGVIMPSLLILLYFMYIKIMRSNRARGSIVNFPRKNQSFQKGERNVIVLEEGFNTNGDSSEDFLRQDHSILKDKITGSNHIIISELYSLQFDGIYPSPFRSNTWEDMLVYVYFRYALEEVLLDFEQRKQVLSGSYTGTSAKSQSCIPKDSLLTIVPDIPSVDCNPPSLQFRMTEDYHCLQFRVMHQTTALVESLGHGLIEGTIRIYLENLLVGEIPVQSKWIAPGYTAPPRSVLINALSASSDSTGEGFKTQSGRQFRNIFVSYSHKDTSIIRSLEKAYKVIGDNYWRDIQSLRSGQVWSAAIEEAIQSADVFQLCWSNQAKSSEFVEREWRTALSYNAENFIRPLYWETPIPEPPNELNHLHFAYYPLEA